MDAKKKAVWIDLDNSPHVPLFVPIIKHYRDSNVNVILTARDHSQTVELLELHGFSGTYTVIGRHHGKGKLAKLFGTLGRAKALAEHIRALSLSGLKISVAVSHGSRAMVLAARWLKIPVLTMFDYEHTETRIFNTFSDRVLVPERIPDKVLNRIGLATSKRVKYPGIKEELYVRGFRPEVGFRENLLAAHGGDADGVLVVLRPPATTANYHSEKSEKIFDGLLLHLLRMDGVFTVIMPRTAEQAKDIEGAVERMALPSDRSVILRESVDGLQLAFAADLVISGGGTMNREAALLGVPVFSIFAGNLGSLDAQMEKEGLITFIREPADLTKIVMAQRIRKADIVNGLTDKVESFVIRQIETYLG